MLWYVDTSALMKLCVSETETEALREFIAGANLAASQLTLTELPRALRRRAGSVEIALALLGELDLSPLTASILRTAADLGPETLRSLDAVHLATALALGDGCDGIITYDVRMQEAARVAGLTVLAPGQT